MRKRKKVENWYLVRVIKGFEYPLHVQDLGPNVTDIHKFQALAPV